MTGPLTGSVGLSSSSLFFESTLLLSIRSCFLHLHHDAIYNRPDFPRFPLGGSIQRPASVVDPLAALITLLLACYVRTTYLTDSHILPRLHATLLDLGYCRTPRSLASNGSSS